jgi:hypothetical protein
MPNPTNVVTGNLVVTSLPDLFCFESVAEFVQQLTTILGVEIPASSISNVIVSNTQPNDSQTTSIWFRFNNAGSFVGIYVFSAGAWIPIYPINDSVHIQIERFTSEDGTAPTGWTKIEAATPGFPTGVAAALAGEALDPGSAGFDTIFWCYFTG